MKRFSCFQRQCFYRSRVITRCLPLLVLSTLCLIAFMILSAFKSSFDDHVSDVIYHERLKITREKTVQLPTLQKPRPTKNRTVLPDDCFYELLRSIDPTCDLGLYCTETWWQEDVLCHVFLHQAAIVPGPAQCQVILDHHDDTADNSHEKKDKRGAQSEDNQRSVIRDRGGLNGGDIEEQNFKVRNNTDNVRSGAARNNGYFENKDMENSIHDEKNNNGDKVYTEIKNKHKDTDRGVHGDLNFNSHGQTIKNKGKGEVRDNTNFKAANIVPRIAYYVLVSESCQEPYIFQFLHYLSVLSVQRFLRPRAIYVLGNCVPIGYWWSRVVSDVKALRFVHRPRPHITEDGQVKWISHLADVIRLQVLLVNGGVYVDTDMILLRPLTPLLKYPLTMGLVDNNTGMGNALILAARGSLFLKEWYSGYRDFRPQHFHWNGMWRALGLWQADPDSVHMESKRFYSPNWYEANLLFDSNDYDISQSYAVHIWHRHAVVPTTPEQFLTLNTTLGRVFRRVYFGH